MAKIYCSKCGKIWPGGKAGGRHGGCQGVWRSDEDVSAPQKEGAARRPEPFEPNVDYVLWDKGKWRGWAVSPVEGYLDMFVRLGKPDGKESHVLQSRLLEEVRTGKAWVTDPIGVLEFMRAQLDRLEAPEHVLYHAHESLSNAIEQVQVLRDWMIAHPVEYEREILPDLTEVISEGATNG